MFSFKEIDSCHFMKTGLPVFFTLLCTIFLSPLKASEIIQTEKIEIAEVWAGHPVNFAIKTRDSFQCVAYYDTDREMIVAARTTDETTWKYTSLGTKVEWDSHNYIDMAIDDSGYIHVSGNMHNVNLIYFRSKKPWSIESFEQPGMVGTLENSVTYPVFIEGPDKKLFFQYRIGGSGDGVTIWNGYNLENKKWTRITDQGLFDNAGSVNAYPTSPVLGPDSCFHIVWMWRDSYIANTNHDLSHIKSSDLVNWQNMAGHPVSIPVGQYNTDVVVDPVASGHGLINMDFWISWDTQGRAVVTYHRYDSEGFSQIFNTRWENDRWKIYQTSDWDSVFWELNLSGSLSHDIAATPLSVDENGNLVQNYVYPRDENVRRWILDENTLKPTSDRIYQPPAAMNDFYAVESTFPGMQVNMIQDGEYYLRWETMPINQDKPRNAGTYPASGTLRLYRFSTPTSVDKNRYPEKLKRGFMDKGVFLNLDCKASFPDVRIYSLNGQRVCNKGFYVNNSRVILTGSMSKGVYIIHK